MGGKPTFDNNVTARKALAKFINLSLYKTAGECAKALNSQYSIEGPCCLKHRAEGLKEAHDMFADLISSMRPFIKDDQGGFAITISAIEVELKARVVIDDLAASAATEEHLKRRFEYLITNYFTGPGDISSKLAGRAEALRSLVESTSAGSLCSVLEHRFPFSSFETNLRNFLKSLDALLPEVLLTDILNQRKNQAPVSLVNSTVASPTRPRSPSPVRRELQANQAKESLVMEPELVSPGSASHKRVRLIYSTNEPETKPVKASNPDILDEIRGKVIEGGYFRGVFDPDDNRFASIADGTDPKVTAFMRERASKAKKLKMATTAVSIEPPVMPPVRTLLDRHESAEKISWESQQLTPVVKKKLPLDIVDESSEDDKVTAKKPNTFPKPEYKVRIISSANDSPSKYEVIRVPKTLEQYESESSGRQQRSRRPYTQEEQDNLIEGIKRFGNDWRRIQEEYKFNGRTNVDLKDKARNLKKHGLI